MFKGVPRAINQIRLDFVKTWTKKYTLTCQLESNVINVGFFAFVLERDDVGTNRRLRCFIVSQTILINQQSIIISNSNDDVTIIFWSWLH